jgi:hypothetical protein
MTTQTWPMRPSGDPQFDMPDLSRLLSFRIRLFLLPAVLLVASRTQKTTHLILTHVGLVYASWSTRFLRNVGSHIQNHPPPPYTHKLKLFTQFYYNFKQYLPQNNKLTLSTYALEFQHTTNFHTLFPYMRYSLPKAASSLALTISKTFSSPYYYRRH